MQNLNMVKVSQGVRKITLCIRIDTVCRRCRNTYTQDCNKHRTIAISAYVHPLPMLRLQQTDPILTGYNTDYNKQPIPS